MQSRFTYVDLLRGFAAYIVLICHYRWLYALGPDQWRADAELPYYSLLWPIYDFGGTAVRLFWVLSGFVFVIAYGGKQVSNRQFWAHRVARLYPLHLLTLAIIAALQGLSERLYHAPTVYAHNDLPHFIAQLFFASNWFTLESSYNAPIWSVSVEVLAYFAFLLYLRRAGPNMPIAVVLTVLFAVLAIYFDNWVAQCFSLFFAGVSIAIATPAIHRRLGARILPLALTGLVASIAAGYAVYWTGHASLNASLAVYLGCPAVLCVFIALDLTQKPLPARWEWIGLSTYSVYLWHMPVIIAVKIAWPGAVAVLPNPAGLLALVFVVGSIGYLSYVTIERPAQRWLRAVLSTPRKVPEPA